MSRNLQRGTRLLADSGSAVSRMKHPAGTSPYFLICDHAGRRLPRLLRSLGLSPAALKSHISWDIGVAGLHAAVEGDLMRELFLFDFLSVEKSCNLMTKLLHRLPTRS